MLGERSFQEQCRALLSSTSPGKPFVSRFSPQESLAERHSSQDSWKQVQEPQPDAAGVSFSFCEQGGSLGILSSRNCWRTTGKDILLSSIYSCPARRAESSHAGPKLHPPSAPSRGKLQRRNVQLQPWLSSPQDLSSVCPQAHFRGVAIVSGVHINHYQPETQH